MGLWSSTFGGGNSFKESVANISTPGDNKQYQGGSLVNTNTNKVIQGGAMNSTATNQKDSKVGSTSTGFVDNQPISAVLGTWGADSSVGYVKGKAPTKLTKTITGAISPVIPIMGKIAGWVNGIDPKVDSSKTVGNREVYTNEKGFSYSYNFLGLPYEVTVDGNTVVDTLSIKGDDGLNGYERQARLAESRGDNDTANQIRQEQQNNQDNDDGGGSSNMELNPDNILEWAKKAGVLESNADLKAITDDPAAYLKTKGLNLADIVNENGVLIDPEDASALLDPNNPNYALGDTPVVNPALMSDVAEVTAPDAATPVNYEASTASDLMGTDATTINAATGEIDADTTIEAEQIDMVGAATGVNVDGTTSVVGNALNDFASQNISSIIDTSTVAGKLLAQKLGEGNYTDSKATILGQMEIISAEFKNAQGEPIIPAWAQGLSRDVQRTMAFSGITGTAQTAAMSNAIMEAVLGIAEKEATFFQTITTKNLDNRQQAIINKASVLANFETANLDARQEAAVQNARNFLEMDLNNLTNEQQAEVVNTQLMMDAIFNDQAAINAARIFGAENANEFQKFYDTMSVQVQTHNSEQINIMKRFNAGEINDASEFNAKMRDSRDQFYANMQFNVDTANAKWRQEVLTSNSEMLFDAYSADIKNSMDINQEGLNRMWDRVDSLLDFMFKGAQTEATLEAQILASEIAASSKSGDSKSGMWNAIGQIGAAFISS